MVSLLIKTVEPPDVPAYMTYAGLFLSSCAQFHVSTLTFCKTYANIYTYLNYLPYP